MSGAPSTPPEIRSNTASIADADLLALWLGGRPAKTQTAYRESAAKLAAFLRRPLATAGKGDLSTFAQQLATTPTGRGRHPANPLAPASQARTLAALKSLYAFAVLHGYMVDNPATVLRVPRARAPLAQRILSEAEVRRLLAAAETARERALLRLLYGGGLRVSEACELRWADVVRRGEGATLSIWGKGGKQRFVVVSGAVVAALAAPSPLPPPADALVLAGLTPYAAWALIKRLARRAGLPSAVSPHFLRHSHASHAIDRGCPLHLLQASLGHASIATTSIYLHANPADGSGRYLPD